MKHTATQILTILDRCCDASTFPMLDNGYVYPAATQLALFRSLDDWAIVIEVFGYSPRSGLPDTQIYTFASRLHNRKTPENYVTRRAYEAYLANNPNNDSSIVFPIEPGDWLDSDEAEFVAERAGGLVLRGQPIQIPDTTDFRRADVELEYPPRIQMFELCRVLAHQARQAVLATPDERRIHVPPELKLLLTLDEWAHPDVVDDQCRPTGSDTFQQLANLLVSGDISGYRPKEVANTHWRNWPDGGTL